MTARTDRLRTVIAAGQADFAERLGEELGGPALRLPVADLVSKLQSLDGEPDERGLVWLHLVPGLSPGLSERDALGEARLLLHSAELALGTSVARGAPVTFLAVLPSPGVFTGRAGAACDLALASMTSLMRDQIGAWSSAGRRIVGIVHAGLDECAAPAQRPPEELRQRTPMGRLGTLGQLADVLRFLGSDRARYVTGTLVRADGGWGAYSWVYPCRTV